jgi:hypothetical protein
MSRTDKDTPAWVAEYYEPVHHCAEFGRTFWNKHNNKACDLVELTYSKISEGGYWRGRRKFICYWVPVEPKDKKKWYDHNPNWWYHEVWLEPERARVRDECRSALMDYNANGSDDFVYDIADYRTKHNGGWFW